MKGSGFPPEVASRRNGGSILVACVFMLSLLSLLALGILNAGGIESSTSASLSRGARARFAALSGIEIAYRRLAEDLDYTGETSTPLDDPNVSVDITVTPQGDYEYEVLSRGIDGNTEKRIRSRVLARQWVFSYPLSIGKDLTWEGTSKILGDCYVKREISGTPSAAIKGDLYLSGQRNITYNGQGEPVMIDGNQIPTITGDVIDCAPDYQFPTIDLSDLRARAAAAGTLYSGSAYFYNQELDGLIYVENCFPVFWDVTIKGTLVCADVPWIIVKGFMKIRCDENVLENVAIIAPDT